MLGLRYDLGEHALIALHNLSDRACTAVVDVGEGAECLADLLDGLAHVPVEGKHSAAAPKIRRGARITLLHNAKDRAMKRLFRDRYDAGRRLADLLMEYAHVPDVLVLALPRGGVPVAYEVALALDAPLDVFVVRKLGVPGHEELAMGAIASGGVRVLNKDVVEPLRIPVHVIDAVAARERAVLEERERAYRDGRPAPEVRGRTVILVDDGLATGSTMRAAARALRRQGPARLVVAVPVAAPETCASFQGEVDAIVCAYTPHPFYAVGIWYADFSQISDDEVRELLARAAERGLPVERAHVG